MAKAKSLGYECENMKVADDLNDFKTICLRLSKDIKQNADEVSNLKTFPIFFYKEKVPDNADIPEIVENLTLAFRHLEDAGMRINKAIQAFEEI